MPISGTVITYNEEDHIEEVIRSLQQVCDEIIVVDSMSTDRTVEIAESHGAKVVLQKYLGEGKQRNVTEQLASHDWILALDADERLDDEMVQTVKGLALDDPAVGYEFNRKSYVGKRWLKGPGFYPDFIVRLYNKNAAGYEPKYGHAGVKAPTVKRVAGHITHYTYDNISDWLARINQVTSLDAQGMFETGRPPSNVKPVLSALNAFVRKFIINGGVFRGIDGFTITLTSVLRSYMKYLKLNELHELNAAEQPPRRN
jgi:glycosyltransferase involved in cell wall biosynthesis